MSFNPAQVTEKIIDFIRDYLEGLPYSKAVMGLSGGLDSATCAFLVERAIGKENTILVNMPYKISSPKSQEDAQILADSLDIPMQVFDISAAVDSFFQDKNNVSNLRIGNVCARVRMIRLYDIAAESESLVVATGNKSERYLGYTTLWGDMAGAFSPIGDLFKSDERALASYLGVPEKLINKIPTADLWADQTDEGEMGIKYSNADRLIHLIYEKKRDPKELISQGYDEEDVLTVVKRYKSSRFKCRMPIYPAL